MAWKNVQYQNGKFKTSSGGGGGSSTFADLDDVSFNNLQNGQVPKYNSTTQKWENANESGGGGTVTDVTVDGTSVVNAQGVAEITMPTPPTIPVQDVEVDGVSVVNAQGVAEITMPTPPAPDYPVTDVKVNGTSVVSNKQALIKSYKEVTQAEYNALPASKTSDGVLYCVKDSVGADGFPPLIYSDEEREVGVWRDGKPLYQKTIEKVASGAWASTFTLVENLPNLETCVKIDIIAHRSGGSFYTANGSSSAEYTSVPNYTAYKFGARVAGIGSNPCLEYYVNTYANTDLDKLTFTLQYTKTTDTPGSGTWTTQGGYAHHYSTTEHVIGTWIDGSTLYEKTVDFGALPNATNKSVAHNISNIDKIANVFGASWNNSNSYIPLPFINTTNASSSCQLEVNATNVYIRTGVNLSSYANTFVTLQYTKTTD